MGIKTWEMKIADRTFKFKLKKATAQAVASKIKAAVQLRQYAREHYTSTFDGSDHISTTMALFGTSGVPIADEAAWQADLAAALDKYAAIVIEDRPAAPNAATCILDFNAIYEKHIPTTDKRRTPEQLAADRAERNQAEAEREAASKARLADFLSRFSNGPDAEMVPIPPGSMAVYLSVTYDDSDAMTDYFDRHRSVGTDLLLAIVPKQAQTQALARRALARYPELAAITSWQWHTETYSMGHGNYLESGYETAAICFPRTSNAETHQEHPCKYEVQFDAHTKAKYPYKGYPGIEAAPAESDFAPITSEGAAIRHNAEKGGIEIRFDAKPAEDVLNRLKGAGWRWSRFSKCWYTKASPRPRPSPRGW